MTSPAPNPPPVETTICVIVTCARCGPDAFDDDGGPWHWPSLDQARLGLEDWDWTDPQAPICPACHIRELCHREGHIWSAPGPQSLIRVCEREIGDHSCAEYQPIETVELP